MTSTQPPVRGGDGPSGRRLSIGHGCEACCDRFAWSGPVCTRELVVAGCSHRSEGGERQLGGAFDANRNVHDAKASRPASRRNPRRVMPGLGRYGDHSHALTGLRRDHALLGGAIEVPLGTPEAAGEADSLARPAGASDRPHSSSDPARVTPRARAVAPARGRAWVRERR